MRNRLPLVLLVATALSVPIAIACGKAPVVPSLSVDAGFSYGSDSGAVPDGQVAPVSTVPDAGPTAPAPSGSASPLGSAASLLDPALDAAIQAQAAKDAPGMSIEGQTGHATLAEGGTFTMLTTLQPGRCYTIVAMSAPLQVSQLEVKLLAPPLFNIEAGRSGASDKNPAVLGKGKSATCPMALFPVPYRVDVIARKGAGRIGVAVYSRAR